MEAGKEEYTLKDFISLIKSFIQFLFQKWWLILLAALAGTGLGVIFHSNQKPKYEAVTTFILEEKSTSSGGLSGLASQFGINLGGGAGSIFSGDNILDILKSKNIVQQVLLSKTDSSAKNNKTFADLYLDFTGIKKGFEKKPSLANISFEKVENQKLSPVQDSILNEIYDKIIKKHLSVDRLNKKGSIIKVQVTAANDVFARLMTERLVAEASELYMELRTGTSQENIRQLQRRSDSLLVLLNRKSYTAAVAQQIDLNPALRTATVPTEIASRDKAVLSTLYAEVTKNLEASKLLMSQQAPVIQLLDKPGLLLNDNKKSFLYLTAFSTLIATVVSILIAGVFFYIKKLM